MIPDGTSLRDAYENYGSSQVIGYYDTVTGQLKFTGAIRPRRSNASRSPTSSRTRSTTSGSGSNGWMRSAPSARRRGLGGRDRARRGQRDVLHVAVGADVPHGGRTGPGGDRGRRPGHVHRGDPAVRLAAPGVALRPGDAVHQRARCPRRSGRGRRGVRRPPHVDGARSSTPSATRTTSPRRSTSGPVGGAGTGVGDLDAMAIGEAWRADARSGCGSTVRRRATAAAGWDGGTYRAWSDGTEHRRRAVHRLGHRPRRGGVRRLDERVDRPGGRLRDGASNPTARPSRCCSRATPRRSRRLEAADRPRRAPRRSDLLRRRRRPQYRPGEPRWRVRYRRGSIGASGVSVSVVGLGGYELGPEPGEHPDPDRAASVIRTALESGVDWLDTSENYLDTQNESLIGVVLAQCRGRRADRVESRTGGGVTGGGSGFRHDEIHAACRASLSRLGRDRLDLYFPPLARPHRRPARGDVGSHGRARGRGARSSHRPVELLHRRRGTLPRRTSGRRRAGRVVGSTTSTTVPRSPGAGSSGSASRSSSRSRAGS